MTVSGYTNLLQELLLSLAGFGGDVFEEEAADKPQGRGVPAPDEGRLRLSKDLTWVDAPERVILDSLARLGFHFRAISTFIKEEEYGGSMYCQALTSGLQELLDVYRAKLLEIQHLVLGGQQAPVLSRLQYLLSDFQALLPEAHRLAFEVQRLRRRDFRGSELLALLHGLARCGSPCMQSCMQRLLWHCNQVLIKQLTSWMIHGLLLDPQKESFIVSQVPLTTAGAAKQVQAQQPVDVSSMAIDPTALPLYISPEVAETILFVGKAVWLLKHPSGAFEGQELLPIRDTLEFVQALRKLQQHEAFQRVKFEHTVEAIRSRVAEVLWRLVVERADLMGHLAAIKDYFLLAKGDFFHGFLVEARALMQAPPRPGGLAETDIAAPFQHSAPKSSAQHDRLFSLFRLRWSPEELKGSSQAHQLDGWDALYLDYKVEWPMGLLLTPQVMARYNTLFQFLMRLKRVQLRLESAWQGLHSLSTHKGAGSIKISADGEGDSATRQQQLRDVQHLRHHMSHLVSNLQIYIQLDVIESNHKQLEDRISAARDFAEAERAHAAYLHALVNQCFLNTGTITRAIGSVFTQVQDLCNMVDLYVRGVRAGRSASDTIELLSRLPVISLGFSQSVNMLYTYLQSSRLQDANKAPHLRQLYMRLNFNGFVGGSMTKRILHAGE